MTTSQAAASWSRRPRRFYRVHRPRLSDRFEQKTYDENGTVCGIQLPEGLTEASEPLFTPSTKAEIGDHDENISFERCCEIVGEDIATQIRDLSLKIYKAAAEYAATRGIIIADTKFEFGVIDGKVTLIDECLTPDSSRFWPAASYEEGKDPA